MMTKMHTTKLGPGSMFAAALLLLVPAAPVPAQPDAVLRDFELSSDYKLWVAGKEVPKAEIFDSMVAGASLIMTSSFPLPVLIGKRSGSVETVDLMKVAKQADGSVDILADANTEPIGTFRIDKEDIVFVVGGKEARLKPTPPLVGVHPRADLLAHSPEYVRSAAKYTPDASNWARLKRVTQDVKVRVYFGSWCPHCRQALPTLLKVEEGLGGSKIAFEYYGLPRPPAAWTDAEAVAKKVGGVPTAIVYLGDKEVGRLQNNDWAKVETSLALLLDKVGVK